MAIAYPLPVSASTQVTAVRSLLYGWDFADNGGGAFRVLLMDGGSGPPSAPTSPTRTGAGNVNTGLHSWKMTFVTALGETLPSVVSVQLNVSPAGVVQLTIPVSPLSFVTDRKIYRTVAGDAGSYLLVGSVGDNTSVTFNDNVADGSLGVAAPAANTSGQTIVDVRNPTASSSVGDNYAHPKSFELNIYCEVATGTVRGEVSWGQLF